MKEFILFSVLALFATKTFGQQIDSSSAKPNVDYLKKSKKQKTAAWVLTSAGTVGLLGTLTADMRQVAGGGLITIFTLGTVEPEYKSYTGYYLLSTAVLGAGIGYFIATSKNKKKAIESSAFIRMEKGHGMQQTMIRNQTFPVVGVRLSL